jgi:hypothetical protein
MSSNNSNRSRTASARGFLARCAITPLAALGILAGTVPAARAADTTCPPTPSGTINGNLAVPAGASCTLTNVTVTGNVQVGKGASLFVEPNAGQTVTIGGNVQAAQCQQVNLHSNPGGVLSVGGNVQIRNCMSGGGYQGAAITIGGNFACDHNSAECFAIGGTVRGNVQVNNNSNGSGLGALVARNNVGGNVQVNNNSAGGDSDNLVSGNTIGGNLKCVGNTPGVTDESVKNIVTGNKQGQCAGANF